MKIYYEGCPIINLVKVGLEVLRGPSTDRDFWIYCSTNLSRIYTQPMFDKVPEKKLFYHIPTHQKKDAVRARIEIIATPTTTEAEFGFFAVPAGLILTNPQSKSRSDLGFSLKSDFPTTHPPPQPEKVSNKQERGLQPKQKLSIYLNRVQIHF